MFTDSLNEILKTPYIRKEVQQKRQNILSFQLPEVHRFSVTTQRLERFRLKNHRRYLSLTLQTKG